MEIIRTASFWRDLKSLIDYFGDAHADAAAIRFVEAVDETIDFIERFPDLGAIWESTKRRRFGIRSRLVSGLENYIIIYQRIDDRIYILRLVDGRRNLEGMV